MWEEGDEGEQLPSGEKREERERGRGGSKSIT